MKLEDVNKKNVHKVPDGYFDELPQAIQARIAKTDKPFFVTYGLRFALPSLIILAIATYMIFFNSTETITTEQLLAEVSTDDIIQYLDESDMTTHEILESIDINTLELDSFEQQDTNLLDDMDLSDNEIDQLLNELGDTNNL